MLDEEELDEEELDGEDGGVPSGFCPFLFLLDIEIDG